MHEVLTTLARLLKTGERCAIATVIATKGSAPQQPGARLLICESGERVGTIGGGAIEAETERALARCLRTGRSEVIRCDLATDLGMCCGGKMEIFVELIAPKPRLILFGAGHVALPTAALARNVGFHVVVVDDREELNTAARFPECELLLAEPVEAASLLEISESDWMVIVTHDHHLDEAALDHYARGPHRYIGMIGARRKVFRVLQRIHARGPLPPLEHVYAPVGLALGAVTPEEIGLSIVAELTALRRGTAATHLTAVGDPRLQKVLSGQLTPLNASRELKA